MLGIPAGECVGVTGAEEHAADAGDSLREFLRWLGAGRGRRQRRRSFCWSFHHAPLRRTGRYQPDGTLDLTWEDGTGRGATDVWEATHNRPVKRYLTDHAFKHTFQGSPAPM